MSPEPEFFDEDTHAPTHAANIADVPTAAGATAAANATAINAILAALRSAGIIEQD